MGRPLADVRVVSVEQYAAGPYATMHLADLGAEIIKIELPPYGDVGRSVPPFLAGDDSLFFQAFNRNKISVCLDVAHPRGREVFRDLVRVADAVFSNLRGDVPDKLAIRFADLAELNPRIVCCSLSGYGMTGPRASSPGFDYMVQGLAGWMSLTGEPDGPPTKAGLSVIDFSCGLAAALATMVAIHAARRDGVGCDCDVSLFDTALSMLSYIGTWTASADYRPGRVPQSGHPTLVPFGNFPTADGWIVTGGSKEKFWQRLAVTVGLGELVDDARFRNFADRLRHRKELLELLNDAFRSRPTQEWLVLLDAAGVPCAPINTVAEALADEQTVARGTLAHVPHPRFGSVGHLRSPVRVGETQGVISNAPCLGEHTATVLYETLGYSESQVRELAELGVILGPDL